MTDNEKELKQILLILQDEGVLNDVVLIGSWVLLFYKQIFDNFDPLVRTVDIDFYVPNVKSFNQKRELVASLKSINFDIKHDSLTRKSTFISPDGFELEFLTKLNRNGLPCVKLGNTSIFGESLSYVEIFSTNYIEVTYYDMVVKVASPASYVLQKLLINERRKDKQEKDIETIKHVLTFANASKKYSLELKKLFEELPKKWKKTIIQTAEKYEIPLNLN